MRTDTRNGARPAPQPPQGKTSAPRVDIAPRHCRLSDYRHDETLGRTLDLVFTVKHQKQRALNRIMRRRLGGGEQICALGGRTARAYRDGLVVHCPLDGAPTQQMPMQEPFGLDLHGRRLAVAAGDAVRVYDIDTRRVHIYRNPWFAQLHSVHFSGDGERLLAVSTGFDTVLEFHLARHALTWRWNAWDHGYDVSPAGVRLARGIDGPTTPGQRRVVVADPADWNGFGLPTYLTAAHVNNACYRNDDDIFITLFHQGSAVVVGRRDPRPREVMTGLLNPHGFEPGGDGDHLVTDTRRGRVIFFDETLALTEVLQIDGCAPAATRTGMGEWLQNTLHLGHGLYAAIDVHRSVIWLFEPATRRYRRVDVNPDWAVQNVIGIDRRRLRAIGGRLDAFDECRHEVTDVDGLMAVPAQVACVV
jgi:hypothetical protein